MAAAAKIAEQQFDKGQCIGMSAFNERFAKWLWISSLVLLYSCQTNPALRRFRKRWHTKQF